MPEPTEVSSSTKGAGDLAGEPMFREPPQEKSFPTAAVGLAAVVVVVGIVLLLIVGRHGSAGAGGAAYASNLEITNLVPSQSESLSGGRSTYIDGHIVNHGTQTVTAATVEAQFGVDGGQAQVLHAPVSVIRARQPYVDTEPLSAEPLAPGAGADFRLIFEGVTDSWDQKTPAIKVVQVSTK